jgi:hypothetical protein
VDVMLTEDQAAELRRWSIAGDAPTTVATQVRNVLWRLEGKRRKDIAEWAVISLPTVDRWLDRYAGHGLAGSDDRDRGAVREQMPSWVPGPACGLVAGSAHQQPRAVSNNSPRATRNNTTGSRHTSSQVGIRSRSEMMYRSDTCH